MSPVVTSGSRLRALLLATALMLMASCGGSDSLTPPAAAPVARIELSTGDLVVRVGERATLTARAVDASGAGLTGRAIAWKSSDPSVATVAEGVIVGVRTGTVSITASAESRSAQALVTVALPDGAVKDVAVTGAMWTQGVQAADGTIPMVLDRAAAVIVNLRAAAAGTTPGKLLLRLSDARGALVHTDTLSAAASIPLPDDGATAQFLVPASVLRPGLRWQVVRDPRGEARDDSTANDSFPRDGPAVLTTVDLPTIRINFVPVALSMHGNITGVVSPANVEDYLQTVRSVHAVGRIETSVLPTLTTSAVFGVLPRGGDAPFWLAVLQDIALARVAANADPTAYWYGVVRPPTGFNFTEYGGFSYIPSDPRSTGASTHVSVGVTTNWFNNPVQSRDLVAHELAHSLGRAHAPCGGAQGTDPNYPFPGGRIGAEQHDVFSWASGRAGYAATVPASTGSIMGYCYPMWASTYDYLALLEARRLTTVASREVTAEPRPVIVVRGGVANGRITLLPLFTLVARPTGDDAGPYRVEGLDALGNVLFARAFALAAVDHADAELFTLAIPVDSSVTAALTEVRVVGPAGSARLDARTDSAGSAAALRAATTTATSRAAARRAANGVVVTCADTHGAAILVTDARTGTVIGSASGNHLELPDAASELRVRCSDGIHTTSSVVRY